MSQAAQTAQSPAAELPLFGRGKALSSLEPDSDPKSQSLQRSNTPKTSNKRPPLEDVLLDCGALTTADLLAARTLVRTTGADLPTVLRVHRFVTPEDLALGLSLQNNTQDVDLKTQPPDRDLVRRFGPKMALRTGLLPWRKQGEVTIVVTANPALYRKHRAALEADLGRTRMATAPAHRISRTLHKMFRTEFVQAAEDKVDARLSCRGWKTNLVARVFSLFLIATAIGLLIAPQIVIGSALGLAMISLVATMGLKLAAVLSTLRLISKKPKEDPAPPKWPVITILVPLFKEKEIAGKLVKRLQRLHYPRAALDVCLVVEADDTTTHDTLARTRLPGWMRVISVPEGSIKTKPRALNFALDFARGGIIGIYDAEDAPEPKQLQKVAARFAARGPEVACLQGVLDFYNPQANWLARCFTIEYATWFRVVLPGLQKLGLVLPLGGTTLFFRRSALEGLQGWDAHNVTEDADLGLRLARRGYRTEMLATTTFEEANCTGWKPWVKQRSRWLKGYAMTYGVHMRAPRALYRDLGLKKFLGVQVLFGATLAQFLLAPVLWLFWLRITGAPSPYDTLMSAATMGKIVIGFLLIEAINISVGLLGVRRSGHKRLLAWVPTAYLYFPLATAAIYKAFWELATRPFYWDKTTHGKSLKSKVLSGSAGQTPEQRGGELERPTPPLEPSQHPPSNGSRKPPKYAA
ncbi:MAG: glycosyltransferase [Pseudomonadota bacterium]